MLNLKTLVIATAQAPRNDSRFSENTFTICTAGAVKMCVAKFEEKYSVCIGGGNVKIMRGYGFCEVWIR